MLEDQYRQLMQAAEEQAWMSVAIRETEAPIRALGIPWERTVTAFNMRKPKLTLAKDDLRDPEILDALRRCRLVGCYVFVPLDDYAFLSAFSQMQDLVLLHAGAVKDLSFLRHMPELFLFYLTEADIPDLEPLISICNEGRSGPGKCFGFRNCRVADTSALREIRFFLSELLIWPAEGDSRERWDLTRASVFRFYANRDA